MRERGRYQLQLMKTRSSSGVGQKIDLEFNLDSLKISDLPEDEQDTQNNASRGSTSIIEQIKRKTDLQRTDPVTGEIDPQQGAPVAKVRANVEGTKLREILNSMNTDEDAPF
jgi:hypothetical protein